MHIEEDPGESSGKCCGHFDQPPPVGSSESDSVLVTDHKMAAKQILVLVVLKVKRIMSLCPYSKWKKKQN